MNAAQVSRAVESRAMPPRRSKIDPEKVAQVLAEARRAREAREGGYRAQALRLLPHVCGRCGQSFAGRKLSELTVHHKDHNHENNPPDGSNWELLCRACHDIEHQTAGQRAECEALAPKSPVGALGFNAFSSLKALLPRDDSRMEQNPDDQR
jgi:5-methylcytosine-specific restriction endonuclease McrA